MLPRVPVSQRHSRASFRASRTDCLGQEGTIKRSLSLLRSTRHPRITDTLCTDEHWCTYVYACARRVLFSASLGADTTSSVPPHSRRDRRAAVVIEGVNRKRERERERREREGQQSVFHLALTFSFFFYFYTCIHSHTH